MGQVPTFTVPDEILELRSLLEAKWPARRAALRVSGVPLNEGELPEDGDDDDLDFEGEFEPARARQLIEKLREEVKSTRSEVAKGAIPDDQVREEMQRLRADRALLRRKAADAEALAKQYEDANKSEAQKLEERATLAEQQAAAGTREASRLRVALKKGLTETQAKRLVGDTEEELEADADELLASFITPEDEPGQDPPRRPRERLRPGAAPSSEPEETDPRKLAALVPRS